MPRKPIIGVTLDWQEKGDFSPHPHFILREHYFDAISDAGGLPVGVSYCDNNITDYVEALDGLLCPGGTIASPADWYQNPKEKMTYAPSPRTSFELNLIKKMLQSGKPVLGICQGMQFLGGLFGAKMTADLRAYYDCQRDYWNGTPLDQEAFEVELSQGSLLKKILGGREKLAVNAHHQEALVELGKDVLLSAKSPDGVVQAIEIRGYDFALGVQWHPEFFRQKNSPHHLIFKAFIGQASQ